MLNAQEIANYLVKNLDAIAATHPDNYAFSILAEIGKGYNGDKINGMVRTVSPDISPYPAGYVEAKYVFVVEMYVSGPTNYRYLRVNKIIDEFIKANQCSTVQFENGKGLVTFSMGVPKSYKIEYGLGEGVPLTFTVRVTYTENGVTSGDKRWFLDGNEIPYLSESVYVEREGMTRKQFTEAYNKTILTGQTKFYSFRIPYESSLYKALQSEILNSTTANGVKHTLTYYDGAAFTEDAPFTATVRVFRTAKSEARRPEGSAFEVTFTDVYNSAENGPKYYIALIDFPFDMQGDDTRFFNSTTEQVDYFEDKAKNSSAPFVEIEAPNLDSLVITKQVYGKSGAPWASQFDFVNKNYAVIKAVSEDKTYYFYYFITNSTIGADGFVTVDLKLDSVQTYFFDENITFSDCLIERAHLNRFVPVDGDPTKVKFVTDPASKIYNAEAGLNFPKRLVKRDKIKLRYTSNDLVDEWLNENVAYWVYIFIDPTHRFKARISNQNKSTALTMVETEFGRVSYFNILSPFTGATNCISYPVYKNADISKLNSPPKSNVIKIKGAINPRDPSSVQEFIPCSLGRSEFEGENPEDDSLNVANKSYYYSIKISMIPPFDDTLVLGAPGVFIDDNNNLIISSIFYRESLDDLTTIGHVCGILGPNSNEFRSSAIRTSDDYGLLFGSMQEQSSNKSFDYKLPENAPFIKGEITKQQLPNLAYNPKLNGQNFKELVITASNGDKFAYDIQKLNQQVITFEYSEPIQPEVTKYYFRVQGRTGLYEEGTDENYTGLVGSTDNSLAYTNDQYAAFIANNKNFFMQSNMKIALGAGSGVADTATKALSGDFVGAATSALSTIKEATVSAIDRYMTVDNMKSAPDQLKNANGNVIFNMFAAELGLYVEKYSALEGDLKTANDFMNLYGFAFSGVANVKDYANIRKFHNYVQAQLQSINGNISNVARTDLRQRFADGIRFWNQDTVEYKYENYEKWLEN